MSTSSRILTFLSRSAPYGSHRPKLCLDAVLASAVFEQKVNYIFLDDGVYQLLKGQDADAIYSKTLGRLLQTLELYGVENVYVESNSLSTRSLNKQDLVLSATEVDAAGIRSLIEEADQVFNL